MCEMTVAFTDIQFSRCRQLFVSHSGLNCGMNCSDFLHQRLEEINSFKEILCGFPRVPCERHFRFYSSKQFLCMGDIADPVYVSIFFLSRALPLGEFRQIGHEPLNKAFEECHHDDHGHAGASSDE